MAFGTGNTAGQSTQQTAPIYRKTREVLSCGSQIRRSARALRESCRYFLATRLQELQSGCRRGPGSLLSLTVSERPPVSWRRPVVGRSSDRRPGRFCVSAESSVVRMVSRKVVHQPAVMLDKNLRCLDTLTRNFRHYVLGAPLGRNNDDIDRRGFERIKGARLALFQPLRCSYRQFPLLRVTRRQFITLSSRSAARLGFAPLTGHGFNPGIEAWGR
jgi:hypothetical protein